MAKGFYFEKDQVSRLRREAQEILRQAKLMGEERAVELLGWVLEKAKSGDAEERQRAQELLPSMIQDLSPRRPPGT